jgi:hypothetical protein
MRPLGSEEGRKAKRYKGFAFPLSAVFSLFALLPLCLVAFFFVYYQFNSYFGSPGGEQPTLHNSPDVITIIVFVFLRLLVLRSYNNG